MSMSTYDALQAWAAGEMPASRAMVLTNTLDLLDLYALAAECDVGVRLDLSDDERNAVEHARSVIDGALADAARVEQGQKIA